MDILETSESVCFNLDVVHEGGFLIAKHFSWTEPRNGIIAFAADKILHVLYQPLRAGATGYFTVKAPEVVNGEWILKYSENFTEVATYGDDDI